MRPIAADIEGTEPEKKFFHHFRTAAAAGTLNFSPFWNRLAPQMGHQDAAVKHAVIALGASLHLQQMRGGAGTATHRDGLSREDVDVFAIQQYNESISKLQRHVNSSNAESIQVTLVCCLAFICLEMLRSDQQAANTHLLNGLKILRSLPASSFEFLSDHNALVHPEAKSDPFGMPDVIRVFGCLEYSACFFQHDIWPVVAEHGYSHRRLDDGSGQAPFENLDQVHQALCCFQRDVVARAYEVSCSTAGPRDDETGFCAGPRQRQYQACLQSRCRILEALVADFLASAAAGTPEPDTAEYLYLQADLLHFRCAQSLLRGMNVNPRPAQGPNSTTTSALPIAFSRGSDELVQRDIMRIAGLLCSSLSSPSLSRSAPSSSPNRQVCGSGFGYRLQVAVNSGPLVVCLGPVSLVAANSGELDIRDAALKILDELSGGGTELGRLPQHLDLYSGGA